MVGFVAVAVFGAIPGIGISIVKRFILFARFGAETFYATLGEAVKAYLGSHPVE